MKPTCSCYPSAKEKKLKRTAASRAPATSRRLTKRRASNADRRNSREREITKIKHLAEVAERERERLTGLLREWQRRLGDPLSSQARVDASRSERVSGP